MKFSKAEEQVLIGISWISKRKAPDRAKLVESKADIFNDELVEWGDSLDDLIRAGVVCENDGALSIAPQAEKEVAPLVDAWISKGFSDWMLKSERSAAYSLFCERLYGKDLCQCSMATMGQLEKLVTVLSLNSASTVLDLGCGLGTITEYLSDTTGAKITGVDIAAGAIERARERTKEKRDRLTFETQNMERLSFPEAAFDTIIAIDTLYFVADTGKSLAHWRQFLTPGGKMGLLYSQIIGPDESKDLLAADSTKLAQALSEANLIYRTWDYTEEERTHWRRSKEIAESLKAEFEKEGTFELYESRIKESKKLLEAVNDDRISRYLYLVEM